ncbi:uncharacterized protein BCR38DRAFT_351829 [Pseudomassariella vexata]|uniref:Peptidase S54 rhomboid domain-containing protein n=1 Tax=Pseudomassariella vexata TaxID=1141098 RepID=A0A1Y2DJ32_9PEZI|nr:uncharacterized protein BCR38DRAFT_351829 [Pseudomassariella vexata]ORY59241.1 hypothetical protein BCR38DRAFT_351829 [Pseudomassariella vexata]
MYKLPPVRVLCPTLWCLGASGLIYIGCAAYEVHQNVRAAQKGRLSQSNRRPTVLPTVESLTELWRGLSGPQRMIYSTVGLNTTLFGMSTIVPAFGRHFEHVPCLPNNYTFFTSMFGHMGIWHLGFNMYALLQFAMPVSGSRTFDGSGSHLTAFYLSSGVMASLAHHLSTIWPNPMHLMSPGLGASGAIMAIIGAFGMTYHDAGIGIMFLPGSVPAQQALAGLALFEAYGLFVGIKFLRFAHGAHLAGLGIGAAYVYFGGKKHVWTPTRRFAFNQMRRFKMI